MTTTWTKNSKTRTVSEEFKSSSRQPQDQVPRTCNYTDYTTTTCYDPQLQGCFIWQCHLSPLGSYIIGSAWYLSWRESQKRSSYLQKRSRQAQNRTVKTVDKLNCKTTTTTFQWVHMGPTECKWHHTGYSSNSWHQLHNSENEHHMRWHQKKLRLPKLFNCQMNYKHPNSFCNTTEQLLETRQPWQLIPYTASVLSFCC